jgi:CheY-like chemotaxis protein
MRLVIRQFLDPHRYEVHEAATGGDALAAADTHRPDLVMLDLGLPDINGREVLRRLRTDAATATIPVVIVTSAQLERSERVRLGQLCVATISKDSLTQAVINDAVRQALDHSSISHAGISKANTDA